MAGSRIRVSGGAWLLLAQGWLPEWPDQTLRATFCESIRPRESAMSFDEDLLARAARVRLLLMDVDGVMTDGTYWQVPDGQGGLAEIKAFDSQDGIAFQWLRRFSVQAGVISGRVSVATEERARSAGFAYVYQGHTEKIPILEEILEKSGLAAEQVAYVGDDFTDVVVMHRVGLAVAVANAKPEVKQHAHWVTPNPGGHGALRDVVELLLKAQGRWEEILQHYELGKAEQRVRS